MNRHALVLASSLALAGCAGAPEGSLGYVAAYSPASTVGVTQGRPLAILPAEAGPVIAVNEKRRLNAITQDIVLGGSQVNAGENGIAVAAIMPFLPGQGNAEPEVKVVPPSVATLEEELPDRFPNVPMHISQSIDHNAQGPFGYATGHGPAGSTCLYAWQFIGPDHPLTLLQGATGQHRYPISVRVRLCKPDVPEDRLIALVRQLIVFAPGGGTIAPAPMASAPMPGADALAVASNASVYAPVAPAPMPAAPVYPAPVYAAPTYAQPVYPVAPTYAAPVPAYPVAPAMAAAEPSDAVVAAPRARRPARRIAERRRPGPRIAVRREPAQQPMIGSAIPMPGDLSMPTRTAAVPRDVKAGALPAAAPAPAVQDSVPLPH